jgi:hypothetical protein
VGLDHGGTSVEGVSDLLNAVDPGGELWVYKNSANTFHPKAFLFRNGIEAELLVGSGNITKGGLYENAEMAIRLCLDLTQESDRRILADVEKALDNWSTPQTKRCLRVDATLIFSLNASGDLPTEAVSAKATAAAAAAAKGARTARVSLFNSTPVPRAPSKQPAVLPAAVAGAVLAIPGVALSARSPALGPVATPLAPTPPPPTAPTPGPSTTAASPTVPLSAPLTTLPVSAGQTFVMTLQNTDVGVGQLQPGAQARSPEVFIPLGALDLNPTFWGWLTSIQPDPLKFKIDYAWRINNAAKYKKLSTTPRRARPADKLDWVGVRAHLVGHPGLVPVNIWFNPDKVDIRLRSEALRSAGSIDDLLRISPAPPGSTYEYEIEVIRRTDPRYSGLLANATKKPAGRSKKKYGFF